jgi:hypothetical protein
MAIEADLVERTLHLSESDRAELACRILWSLERVTTESTDPHALDEAIECRLEELGGSELALSEWRDAVDRAREALKTEGNP